VGDKDVKINVNINKDVDSSDVEQTAESVAADTAKANAESMTIRANALSQNPKLVEWEAVQKWNGELPNYMLGGATPFINMTAK